ncbi:TetR/AcrR family transcriptional regulator [Bacillus coahuilensis]|uniref:TetR/AcrR family transcriptional regulator n=1 Tax=Bacillus coahuilensis TaxID=408580 RepID=UPI0001850AF9|nr:TetR/AcrR family transcriptional regulator [Bacillus coahuilensis]
MNGFELRAEKKKEAIIDTAIVMFQTMAPKNVSVRELAKKANVSVVSIYNYFGNKDGLMIEAVKKVFHDQLKMGQDILDSKDSFEEKMKNLLFTKESMLNHFHPEFLMMCLQDENISSMINEDFLQKTNELTTMFINQAKEEGTLSDEYPNEFIFKVLELYKRDLTSPNSLLLSGQEDLKQHKLILHSLLYGITGNKDG